MSLTLSLLLSVAAATEDSPPNADYRSYVDQARFFMKKQWFDDAGEQLELAVKTDDGALDPETWFLLATVRYQLAQLAEAREAADRALVNSRTNEQTGQAEEFLSFLDQQFGVIELKPPRVGIATMLDVELKSIIFDPQLKEYFNKLTTRLEDQITLPYAIGLPTGTYSINGDEVEIVAGTTLAHDVVIQARGPTSLQLVQIELSVGARTLFGAPAPDHIPAPQLEVGISQPLGVFVLGGVAEWTAQPFQNGGSGVAVAPTGWSAGARFGVETQGEAEISLRPSLTARYGAVPGVELGCDPGPILSCVPNEGGNPGRLAYVTGHALMFGGEVALLYRDRTQKSGLGAGLKTSVDGLLGGLPSEGEALAIGGAPARAFEIGDNARSWTAIGLRVHFGVSYAL